MIDEIIHYRIFHYFILLREGREYFIYNANGSDTLHAHPMKIKITLEEFNTFIKSVNELPFDKDKLELFILTYFMEGATTPFYFDEGCNRTKFVTIQKGKKIELAHYDEFKVAYFPTVRNQLIFQAAKAYIDVNPRLNDQITECMQRLLLQCNYEQGPEDAPEQAPEQAAVPPRENIAQNGAGSKKIKRSKRRTKKNKRLKLKTRSFSKRMKR